MKQGFYILVLFLLASFATELALDITFALKYEIVDILESVDDNENSQEEENEENATTLEKKDVCLIPMADHIHQSPLHIKNSIPAFAYLNNLVLTRSVSIPELPPETV